MASVNTLPSAASARALLDIQAPAPVAAGENSTEFASLLNTAPKPPAEHAPDLRATAREQAGSQDRATPDQPHVDNRRANSRSQSRYSRDTEEASTPRGKPGLKRSKETSPPQMKEEAPDTQASAPPASARQNEAKPQEAPAADASVQPADPGKQAVAAEALIPEDVMLAALLADPAQAEQDVETAAPAADIAAAAITPLASATALIPQPDVPPQGEAVASATDAPTAQAAPEEFAQLVQAALAQPVDPTSVKTETVKPVADKFALPAEQETAPRPAPLPAAPDLSQAGAASKIQTPQAQAAQAASVANDNSNNSGGGSSGNSNTQTSAAQGVDVTAPANVPAGRAEGPTFSKVLQTAHSPNVASQMEVQIRAAAKDGASKFAIQLHPAELGKLEIHMEVSADGKAQLNITAETRAGFEALQKDIRGLERILADAGLKTDTGSLNFNMRGEQQAGRDQAQPASSTYPSLTAEELDEPVMALTRSYRIVDGLDIVI